MFDRLARFDPLPRSDAKAKLDLAALFLRLALAAIFLAHAFDKIFGAQAHWGTNWATRQWMQDMTKTADVPALLSPAVQMLVAYGELVGGVALLIGLFSRIAAALMIVIQIGAIWLVTSALGFSMRPGGGVDFNLALIAMCLAVVIVGDGALTVDKLLSPAAPAEAREAQPVG